jgi:hypothetical protein
VKLASGPVHGARLTGPISNKATAPAKSEFCCNASFCEEKNAPAVLQPLNDVFYVSLFLKYQF